MTTPNLDGPPASPASVEIIPTEAQPLPVAVASSADEAKKPKFPDKDFLRSLGLTKAAAKRLLANGKSEDYLNTKITARVYLVHQTNSAEQLMMAQRRANLIGKDSEVEPRTRAACLAVVAQCAMALARLSEVALATARNMDAPDEAGAGAVVKPVQNNFFGFPPVAPNPRKNLQASAKTGDEETTDTVVEVTPAK